MIINILSDDSVVINLQAIQNLSLGNAAIIVQPLNSQQYNQGSQPVYVPKEGVFVVQPGMAPPGAQYAVAAVQAPASQMHQMRVTVPSGSYAGSSILVNTPSGGQVQVVIPAGNGPGDEFIVQY